MSNDLFKFLTSYCADPEKASHAVLDAIGTTSAKALGSGQKGTAFAIDGGRVLKLTTDKSEANAMALVAAHPSPYVVRVYDVFKLGPKFTSTALYGIVQERLSSPDASWSRFINSINDAILHGKFLSSSAVSNFRNEFDDTDGENAGQVASVFMDQRFDWIQGLAEYFESVGIKFMDFHAGNLMKSKSGGHVMIDLGVSKSPAATIRVQESASTLTARMIEDILVRGANAAEEIERHIRLSFMMTSEDRHFSMSNSVAESIGFSNEIQARGKRFSMLTASGSENGIVLNFRSPYDATRFEYDCRMHTHYSCKIDPANPRRVAVAQVGNAIELLA